MAEAAIDYSYRYDYPSHFSEKGERPALHLATSGGRASRPHFFTGVLTRPHKTALCLKTLARIVQSRYYIPPAMRDRLILLADPVVTVGGGVLRFEVFSSCCGVYARVDLSPGAYDGDIVGKGTTNVDFNADARACLSRIRDYEHVELAIGTEGLTITREKEAVVEKKVKLPTRWLRGFVEVQSYQSRMLPRLEMGRIDAVRFLRSMPRSGGMKSDVYITPSGGGCRLSASPSRNGVRIAGLERLKLLENLIPYADALRIFSEPGGEANAWVLNLGPIRFTLALSADVWRGFSGEGQALNTLALGVDPSVLAHLKASLRWQSHVDPADMASRLNISEETTRNGLERLGALGLVGFDLDAGTCFHRELPFDMEKVEAMHPRLVNARKIIDENGARIVHETENGLTADVRGSRVVHRVRVENGAARCTCQWFAKHQGNRGPCKHILAATILGA